MHLREIAEAGALPINKENSSAKILTSPDAADAMTALESTCKFWARWVMTYLERTNIRINLVSSSSFPKASEPELQAGT